MRYLFVLLSLYISVTVSSQTEKIQQLQNQKKNLQIEIENTNKLYLNIKKQTTTILQRVNLINKQIASRKTLIDVQNKEITALDNELIRLEKDITHLNKELKQRQDKYAEAIKIVMHKKQSENKIFFILSAKSFGESIRRMQYLKQYTRVQKSQAEEIRQKNRELEQKKKDVQNAKEERSKTLLAIQLEQSKLIEEEKNRKGEMNEAQGKQKELQKMLQDKQKQANQLNAEIERLIAEEVARQEREAKRLAEEQRRKREEQERIAAERRKKEERKQSKKGKTEIIKEEEIAKEEPQKEEPLIASAETFNLSKNFIANKGLLPMPVTGTASIISSFGIQKHQEWNVSTNNSGIDIQAQSNANIRAVFEGEVSRVVAFPGFNNCVIIRHGDYYTFYGNIINVYVKQGQKVKTGEALGKIYTDSDTGVATMHFQLWQKTNKLNPAPWLKR